jgi:hypothetical protein
MMHKEVFLFFKIYFIILKIHHHLLLSYLIIIVLNLNLLMSSLISHHHFGHFSFIQFHFNSKFNHNQFHRLALSIFSLDLNILINKDNSIYIVRSIISC